MKYYIGLDLGTNSVGYAATDEQYQLLKTHQKPMAGVRLFDEAQTAAKRRQARISKRRLERRNQRLALLEDLFSQEISKIDPGFFQRLKSSYFLPEDKEGIAKDQQNTLFNDPHFTDRDYHINYPTIYHLRQELMTSSEPHDVRLVFLALHHILKHRGHFLTTGEIGEPGGNLENSYSQLLSALSDDFSVDLSPNLAEPIKQILINKTIRRSEKLDALVDLMDREEEIIPLLAKLLVGFSVDIHKLFGEQYKGQSP